MKKFKKLFATYALPVCSICFAISIMLSSCSKDDEPVAVVLEPLQDPLSGYLVATGFNQKVSNLINIADYEFGYSFIPLVNGKMTAIVVKIPDTKLAMRVTVWDKVAGTVLLTETIDVPTANVEVVKQITALDLVKDKEYFLTFNNNDWYDRRKTDGSAVIYPFTVGDIKITSYGFKSGTAQAIPNSIQTTYYAGDCSFKFQK